RSVPTETLRHPETAAAAEPERSGLRRSRRFRWLRRRGRRLWAAGRRWSGRRLRPARGRRGRLRAPRRRWWGRRWRLWRRLRPAGPVAGAAAGAIAGCHSPERCVRRADSLPDLASWVRLTKTGASARRLNSLIEQFGSPEALFALNAEQLASAAGL